MCSQQAVKKAHRKFVEDGVWRAGGDGADVKGMGQGGTRNIAVSAKTAKVMSIKH